MMRCKAKDRWRADDEEEAGGHDHGHQHGYPQWRQIAVQSLSQPPPADRKAKKTVMIAASSGLIGRLTTSTTAATDVQIARARGSFGCSTMQRAPHHAAKPEEILKPLEVTTAIMKSTIGDRAISTQTKGVRRGW